jgi:hypothetical protein
MGGRLVSEDKQIPRAQLFEASAEYNSDYRTPARWRIEVRSANGTDFRFKCAIAIDDTLQLMEDSTPYDFEFLAAKFRALFEAIGDGPLSVTGFSDVQGEFRMLTSFSGSRCGQVVFDPLQQDGHIIWGSGTRL